MIKTFKIVRKIYDEETVPKLTPSSVEYTRGHQHKLDTTSENIISLKEM